MKLSVLIIREQRLDNIKNTIKKIIELQRPVQDHQNDQHLHSENARQTEKWLQNFMSEEMCLKLKVHSKLHTERHQMTLGNFRGTQ